MPVVERLKTGITLGIPLGLMLGFGSACSQNYKYASPQPDGSREATSKWATEGDHYVVSAGFIKNKSSDIHKIYRELQPAWNSVCRFVESTESSQKDILAIGKSTLTFYTLDFSNSRDCNPELISFFGS